MIVCTPKSLPAHLEIAAASRAVFVEPRNLVRGMTSSSPVFGRLALVTDRKWPSSGVRLTVGFMDNAPQDLRARILSHMNAWGLSANVKFVESARNQQVRIAREEEGYWSYLGTDILLVPPNQQTMNLEGFTMRTSEREFRRVVRHETGHTLGFPHEHMRRQLVALLNRQKTIRYFMATQGWSSREVIQQVLTPLNDRSLTATAVSDAMSIMCYQIPGNLTNNGRPIIGGLDIGKQDYEFAAKVYPKK